MQTTKHIILSLIFALANIVALASPYNIIETFKPFSEINNEISIKILKSEKLKISTYRSINSKYEIVISDRLVELFAENQSALAFSLAHELGHIKLSHFTKKKKLTNEVFNFEINRQQEYQADKYAVNLLLKSGYSLNMATKGLTKLYDSLEKYSDYESLSQSHPSWESRMKKIDATNEKLWESMLSFRNGVTFLNLEQYELASEYFANVANEFPKSYEAWANKGYADLLLYADNLSLNDIKSLNLACISLGNFYYEPESIKWQMRGMDSELWLKAYSALKTSLDIEPNQPITSSNMALAYLINPFNGPDYTNSKKYFARALMLLENGFSIPKSKEASIYMNTAVSNYLEGELPSSLNLLKKSSDITKEFFDESNEIINLKHEILLNEALVMIKSKNSDNERQAIIKLEEFLKSYKPNSIWRQLAIDNYLVLCKKYNIIPKKFQDRYTHSSEIVKISSIKFKDFQLYLSDKYESVKEKINTAEKVKYRFPGKYDISILQYYNYGINIYGGDKIFAIEIYKNQGYIELEEKGLGSSKIILKVGDNLSLIPQSISNQFTAKNNIINFNNSAFSYSKELGLGLEIKDEVISRILVVNL